MFVIIQLVYMMIFHKLFRILNSKGIINKGKLKGGALENLGHKYIRNNPFCINQTLFKQELSSSMI